MRRRGVQALLAVVLAPMLVAVLVGGLPSVHASAVDDPRLTQFDVHGQLVTGIPDIPEVGDRAAIRRYHDTGQFQADRELVAGAAEAALAEQVAAACPLGPDECRAKRLAIIVDIDDTLLDWYPTYASHGFVVGRDVRQAAVKACATPVIAPTRRLVRAASASGVAVLLLSGRRNPARQLTQSCLERRGLGDYESLTLRTRAQDRLPAASYKQQAFTKLVGRGWVPILSIGDQRGDLVGSAGTPRFLLPNPLYRAR